MQIIKFLSPKIYFIRLQVCWFAGLLLGPVDQKQLVSGTREGCIEPVNIVGSKHIIGHISLVHIYMRPLSALCLMAGHGIGVLDLQGIEISILANRLHAVGLQWHKVLIVFLHLPEEFLLLLVGKGRRLALQGVEHTRHLHLVIIVVGQLQQQCGKRNPYSSI